MSSRSHTRAWRRVWGLLAVLLGMLLVPSTSEGGSVPVAGAARVADSLTCEAPLDGRVARVAADVGCLVTLGTPHALEPRIRWRHAVVRAADHLARQLVATKLNLAAGSDPSILPAVAEADVFLELFPPGSDPQGEDRELAEALNLDKPIGALVSDVNPGSAAEKAGIQPGDVILEFDGEVIEVSGDLPPIVGANPPGTKAEVVVSRNGKRETFEVVLDALESDENGNIAVAPQDGAASNRLGLKVESIAEDQRRALGDPEGGVIISAVEDDAAYRAGLRRGDVVLAINNRMVEDVAAFEDIAESLPSGKAVALRVMRDGVVRYIAYTPTAED